MTATMVLVHSLLRSRALYYLGASALTYVFWWSGLTKLWDFTGAQEEMVQFGLNPAVLFAAVTIGVQLGGSALVIFDRNFAWLGAGALGGFTLATIPIAHRHWTMEGLAAILNKALVQEHFSVIGGLILAAILAQHEFGDHHESHGHVRNSK
jgi:transmembrane protein